MRARKKFSKRLLALLLSAVMIAEPAGSSIIVHATEADAELTEAEGTEGAGGQTDAGTPESAEEENKDSTSEEQENGESNPEDQGSEESGEKPSDNQQEETENQNPEDQEGTENQNPEDQEGTENQNPEDQEGTENQNPDDQITDGEEPGEEGDEAEDSEEEDEEAEDEEEKEENTDTKESFSMPSDYELTSKQKQMKAALAASMSDFDDSAEGVQYAEREVFTFADSREEAELIAAAYHAELIEYDEGIAVLKLQAGAAVGEALRAAASADNNLPAVYANYYRYIHVEEQQNVPALDITEEEFDLEGYTFVDPETEEPGIEAYMQAVEALGEPNMAYDSNYYQWQHVNVGSVYAWDAGYKGSGVKVAVLDSGVSGNADVTPIVNINKTDEADANDGNGHGTHVAGIIAAQLNGQGGAGIAPEAQIVNVRVLNSAGSGTDAWIAQGVRAAIAEKVDIINMSLGGIGYSPAMQEVVDEAYKAGIAVFVSAGNDGGTNMCYPAACDNVICVGATDSNNQRASFSNYGAWVDLSAPGVSIWSTGNNGGFVNMSGTSQACPVAVGEAAVILSSGKVSGTGSGRVDELENLMKSNAVSVGSGMGKGITSLPKVFNLSTAVTKPAAPEIEVNVADDKQTVSVTIKAQAGMTIYYTDNGKAPSFKNGAAGAGTICAETNPVILPPYEGQQKIVISAIAVNESGVPGKVTKKTIELKPWVTELEISGVSQIARKKSAQLTAEVGPSYAKDKSLTWSIDGNPAGISVNAKGKVTVTASAKAGDYTVRVVANDRKGQEGQVEALHTIKVLDSEYIKSAKFAKTKDTISIGGQPETYNVPEKGQFTPVKKPEYVGEVSAADFVWSSSNKALATVDRSSGIVTAKAPGNVKITATANDGSNKKAVFTLTIKQLATSMTITGDDYVAAGASITLKAVIGPEKVSSKKVEWTSNRQDVSVKNGVVKPGAGASGECIITATAADGSQVAGTKTITIKSGKISGIKFDKRSISILRPTDNARSSEEVVATITGNGDCAWNAYTCTSSNPGIATAAVTDASKDGTVKLAVTATGKAVGKTTITLMATDGSKKKATCNVTVTNPVSKININPAAGSSNYVAKGKTLQLKAALESEYGIVGNKKVIWELYTATLNGNSLIMGDKVTSANAGEVKVSISSSGKIKAEKDAAEQFMVVQATAADNGGARARYAIRVTTPVKKVALYGYFSRPNGLPAYEELNTKSIYVYEQLTDGGAYTLDLMCDFDPKTGKFTMPAGGVIVSSSNPKVMSATFGYDSEGYPVVRISADNPGNATITVKAMDGGNAQVKLKFKVVEK